MKHIRKLLGVFAFSLFLILQACGGNNTNGTLALSAPTSVTAGKTLQVTATFTSSIGATALPINFSCSDPTVVLAATKDTDSTGVATAQLITRNIINGDKTVTITASTGGLSSSQNVVIRANKLVFISPSAASFNVTAGSTMEYFVVGPLVRYTDADDMPLAGQPISFKVNTVVGVTDVKFHWALTETSYLVTNPFTLTTLSDGTLSSVVSLIAVAPGTASVKFDYNANFIISVTDPNFGTMSIPGDLPFSITAQ